ncbi:MAG: hypothetical protein GX230_09630, partial [Lentisphaerae bacterium]|nr:hypothetical protein [Lentisphaerota bacterium]
MSAINLAANNELRGGTSLVRMLRLACENTADDDGWSSMSRMAEYIRNLKSHAAQNYGFSRRSGLVAMAVVFATTERTQR